MAPRRGHPSVEQQEQFLELVEGGDLKQEAAEKVGCTSTRFRSFINGKSEESLAFAQRYLDILEEAGRAPSPLAGRVKEAEGIHLAHRLLDETIMRALDSERGRSGSSNKMLYNLTLLKLDDFKPLLEARTRHIHEGAVGVYSLPQLDVDRWSIAEHEEFVALETRRNELLEKARPAGAPNVQHLPLPAGPVVEDAEFEELDDSDEGGAGVREPSSPRTPLGSSGIKLEPLVET